jgi:CRP-like cAMP-binding protein
MQAGTLAYSPAGGNSPCFFFQRRNLTLLVPILCDFKSKDGMAKTTGNRLLDALSANSLKTLLTHAREVALPVRTRLYWPGEMPAYGYFLTSGIASVVAGLNDGGTAEVAVIGNEGLVGALHIIGPIPAMTECFMQVAGSGYRIALPTLRTLFNEHDEIRGRILEFVQSQNLAVSQVAACNKFHEAEPRLARWLLMISDRVDSDTIYITQEFIAQMIGTRRTTVNGVLSAMQRKGLLTHERGKIILPARKSLEKAACDCYPLIRKSLFHLYS